MNLATGDTIKLRAAANSWISKNFPQHRKYLTHSWPQFCEKNRIWSVALGTKNLNGHSVILGKLLFDSDAAIVRGVKPSWILQKLRPLLTSSATQKKHSGQIQGEFYDFRLGDGIQGGARLVDGEIDLLLTDPPYGISQAYTCERQIPRRLRKNGRDFIMPKGNFGAWDKPINPSDWLEPLLPKVGGWFLTFCAQAQIGEYVACLLAHKFVAVGTMVWQKTNPVPFNHKFKPINAWEAMVVGKRPGTKFNGKTVHNVFLYKSPSPQKRIHRTQKPLDLMSQFVSLFSDEGDFVYDPFAGGATTLIAAHSQRRRVLAYERDQAIFQSACDRVLRET